MVYIYIYEEPLCLTRARGSSGKRSQPLKELLAKKYLVCVCVACATTCCWDKGNYCQLHLDTSNSMLGHAMASHSIGGMAVQKNKRPQFDEKHVANRPTGSDYLFSPDGVPPTNIYLMSNMIFFSLRNRSEYNHYVYYLMYVSPYV